MKLTHNSILLNAFVTAVMLDLITTNATVKRNFNRDLNWDFNWFKNR